MSSTTTTSTALGSGAPKPDASAPSGGQRSQATPSALLREVRTYYDKGLIPVPVAERKPCVQWEHRLGWKTKALQGELPPWEEVANAFVWAGSHRGADGIAVILRPGVLVIDPDTPDGLRWLAQRELPTCPSIRGRRGSHYWYGISVPFEGVYHPVEGVEFLGAGHLVYVVPSHKEGKWKRWVRRFGNGPLPAAPEWATQLLLERGERSDPKPKTNGAAAESAVAKLGKLLPITPEDLPALREHVSDVRITGLTATGTCPFPNHADAVPSFVLYRRASDGQIHWRDFGKCAESRTRTKRSASAGALITYHSGTLRELRRLLGLGGNAAQHNLAFQAAAALTGVDPDVEKFVHLLLLKAKRYMLDLREEVDYTFREIARNVGCERLVETNPDGRPHVHLRNNGRSVNTFIVHVQAQTGLTFVPGRSYLRPEGRRNTAFIIPQAWITPPRAPSSVRPEVEAAEGGPRLAPECAEPAADPLLEP